MDTANNCLDLSSNVDRASDEGREELASDVFVKFLMNQNISLDVSKDSQFQNLLRNVAQQGQQSCLFLDNYTVLQNSLWKFENEIKQYMRMVIESWMTTECTLMSYNVKGAGKNQLVFGFYCPKGFIFLQGGRSEDEVGKELADLVPDLPCSPSSMILHFVRHDCSYHSKCQYQAFDVTGCVGSLCYYDAKCIRQQVHVLWMRICKTSKWVQSLIKKVDEIFQCMSTSNLSEEFYNTLKQRGVEHVYASSFARLRMVMRVRSELTAWLSCLQENEKFDLQNDTDVITIIHNNEFWNDGNQLVQVLSPFYKVPSLVDTLVPSAGYLKLAIDKASGLLKTYSESEPLKYKQIWECFQLWRFDDCFELDQDLACFLNPSYYIIGQDLKEDIVRVDWLERLYDLARAYDDGDEQKLDAEVDAYNTRSSNPFAGVSEAEFEANHPVTLWSKYGGGFPLLQKCAYILLSQPGCCLCKQVEKFASKVIGSDNFILRLNGLMMEEFGKLGDQIYQPIHI